MSTPSPASPVRSAMTSTTTLRPTRPGARSVSRIAAVLTAVLAAAVAGLVGVLGLGALPGLATPAWAHGADAPEGTDYRTLVTALTPDRPGLTVRAVEAGAQLELVNRTGRTIEVLGYAGEPYLEVRPDGVYENVNSPATYLNRSVTGQAEPPASADPTLPPSWRRIATEPVVRWHDQRTHWMESTPPAEALADPSRPHRIRDWVVPLRDEFEPVEIRGTLDWLPPPNPLPWWAGAVLGALAISALGLLPVLTRSGRAATIALAALASVGGVGAIAFAALRELDAGAEGPGEVLAGLFTGQLLPVLVGLGALTAGAYALIRRPAGGDFGLTLAGACLGIFVGVANATVFLRAVAPVPGAAIWARLLVALAIVTGVGVSVAGILRLRAAARARPPTPKSLARGQAVTPGGTEREGGDAERKGTARAG